MPETLHITDGRQGRAEDSKAKDQVYQLTTEEATVASDIIVGMYLLIFPIDYSLLYAYVYTCD